MLIEKNGQCEINQQSYITIPFQDESFLTCRLFVCFNNTSTSTNKIIFNFEFDHLKILNFNFSLDIFRRVIVIDSG